MEVYVIVNTNDVTDEMKDSTPVQQISYDNSLTVFGYQEGNKPECFKDYEELEKNVWYNKYYNEDSEIWNGPIPGGIE
jgi:hypothetical protein